MKTLEEQIANKCRHFNGISEKTCKAGVCYDAIADATKSALERFPCFREGESTPCEKRDFLSEDEVLARVAEIKESTARTMKAMVAAFEDAKRLGLKKGKGGTGSIKCPCCEGGTLGYSVASINGHLWGKCSTENCVGWMM